MLASIATAATAMAFVSPDGHFAATTVADRAGGHGTQQIVIRDRRTGLTRMAYGVHESFARGVPAGTPGPIVLIRWSGDSRWIFFAIDPMGSQSLAADGLIVQVVSVRGGRPHRLALMLAYRDYFAWCNNRLVFTAGGDRLATTNKRLLIAAPPFWQTRALVQVPRRAWGSVVCSPDGRSVVVQSQRESEDYNFGHTRWALWRVSFDGSAHPLTSPPRGYTDESPRFSRQGQMLMFVRSRRGYGRLYELRNGRVFGPVRSLGYNLGYYGHHDWWSEPR
jgi:hypothetical protein